MNWFQKTVIVSHTKSELIRAVWEMHWNISVDDLVNTTWARIQTQTRTFRDLWSYGEDVVLQRWVLVINEVRDILVSSGGNLPPDVETVLISGSGSKNYRTILGEKTLGAYWTDRWDEMFALSQNAWGVGTYGFLVRAVLGVNDPESRISRELRWESMEKVLGQWRITTMERNLLYHFRTGL